MGGSTRLIGLLKHFEGFAPEPYWDCQQYSIGYGSKYRPGLTPNPISEPQALQLLHQLVQGQYRTSAKNAVESRGISWTSLPSHQQDAIISFCYNLGPGAIMSASWPQRLKEGNLEAAKQSWVAHYNADGHINEGLVRRRFAEWQLFTTGTWSEQPAGWQAYYNAHR